MNQNKVLSLSIASVALLVSFGSLKLIDNHLASTRGTLRTGVLSRIDGEDKKALGAFSHERISTGEKALVQSEKACGKNENCKDDAGFRSAKKKGVSALANGDYTEAVNRLSEALQAYPNAPETLIYLNNARIEAEEKKSYLIAAAVPITNDIKAAQAMLRGVAQAQNQINKAGGINGVSVRVAVADDGENAEAAQEIAAELGRDSEVLGVVGHYYSSRTLATAEIYQEQKLPIIALSSSIKISGLSDYVFRTSPSDAVTAEALATHMLTHWQDKRKVAIFYDSQEAYSQSLKEKFQASVRNLGGEVVESFDWSETSFDSQLSFDRAIAKDAQVLMLVPSTAEQLENEVFEIAQLNTEEGKPFELMGGDVVYSPDILEKDTRGDAFVGMVVGAFWHIDAASNSDFVRQSNRLWKGSVNWMTALAYDASQVWIEAFWIASSQGGSNSDISRTQLQEILASPDFSLFNGASGQVSFTEEGDRKEASVQLVEVISGNESATRHRFEPVRAQ